MAKGLNKLNKIAAKKVWDQYLKGTVLYIEDGSKAFLSLSVLLRLRIIGLKWSEMTELCLLYDVCFNITSRLHYKAQKVTFLHMFVCMCLMVALCTGFLHSSCDHTLWKNKVTLPAQSVWKKLGRGFLVNFLWLERSIDICFS